MYRELQSRVWTLRFSDVSNPRAVLTCFGFHTESRMMNPRVIHIGLQRGYLLYIRELYTLFEFRVSIM